MLNQQQAQQRLDAIKLKDGQGQARMVQRLLALKRPLREIGLNLRELDGNGHPLDRKLSHVVATEAAQKFIALSNGQRATLFDAWFGPKLGRYADRAYTMDKPYQIDYTRKAFRAESFARLRQLGEWSWLWHALDLTQDYDQPLNWFAEYAGYLGYHADALGWLFAAAIDLGGDEGDAVFDILTTTADGAHPIGVMGRHVTRGLLAASRPDGWACIERLLLAAQRQEGLRQVILESVDECHPVAFKRMLRLILDNKLTRFSATLRAFDMWLGFQLQIESAKRADQVISRLLYWLEHDDERETLTNSAKASPEPEQLYLALWASAYFDAPRAAQAAVRWLFHAQVEHRFVAVHFLGLLELHELTDPLLVPCLSDDDLRICARAFRAFGHWRVSPYMKSAQSEFFEKLEALLARLPTDETFEPFVWPWMSLKLERSAIADLLIAALGDRSPKRLISYIALMSPYRRGEAAQLLAKQKPWDAETRQILFKLMGDPSSDARARVIKLFADDGYRPTDEEAIAVEKLLMRKASDLRRAAIELLLRQPAERARASAERLAGARNADQRAAGVEMLAALDVQSAQSPVASLNDALGLMNPHERTSVIPPQTHKVVTVTPAAIECLKSLDALIDDHAQTLIQVPRWNWGAQNDERDASPMEEIPLGNATWRFPRPNVNRAASDDVQRLPLAELWESWWRDRPRPLLDKDGFELVRAALLLRTPLTLDNYEWHGQQRRPERNAIIKALGWLDDVEELKLSYRELISHVLKWLIRLHPTPHQADFVLDVAEHSLALIDRAGVWNPGRDQASAKSKFKSSVSAILEIAGIGVGEHGSDDAADDDDDDDDDDESLLRDDHHLRSWIDMAQAASAFMPDWDRACSLRLWRLLHWADEPYPNVKRSRPPLELVLLAWVANEATEADVLDQLLGERSSDRYYGADFSDLRALTTRKPHELFTTYPKLRSLVERCKARILEIELARGDLPTAATPVALCIRSLDGMDVLLRLMVALDRQGITRGRIWHAEGKSQVLSHLIRVCSPRSTDAPEAFAKQCKTLDFSEQRLVELGVFVPQWARFIECALGWPGAAEAVWWLHAHTKERAWHVEQEVREAWQAEISEYTALKPDDLLDGAADVAWFRRAYAALGAERWEAIYSAAKFASGGAGHSRARLFADAMLGRLDESELIQRIKTKRHQDSVRALGLLPMATEPVELQHTVLGRYNVMQEFLRSAKQFGSQRQASEKLAVRIGLQNLARSAGYPDPVRLEWAMEIQTLGDLADGPIGVSVGDVTATLYINAVGEAKLDVERAGAPAKTVPTALKKIPSFVALKERQRELVKQAARIRTSLEQAMVRGDVFTVAELRTLFTHPILRVMLEQLVFVTADGALLGYATKDGELLDYAGGRTAIGKNDKLRVAHPLDLLHTQEWHLWQQECYRNERIQPFKQVFREVYVPTRDEREASDHSRRYAGHQVNPRQAAALLGARGWIVRLEEGASRTFHDEDVVAWINTNSGFLTPAEVEPPTIETLHFSRRGEWQPLPLTEVPPRIFSEVLRDLDLLVSVAHVGGVDPEASASTVEMRKALLRESSRLLKLTNVEFKGSHALITGKLNRYSVHLGSGVVHQQPGGYVCIVPVQSQHRGRLFLPFMDNDPRTAEVLSKVLLLARDEEIKDPSILEQITRVT